MDAIATSTASSLDGMSVEVLAEIANNAADDAEKHAKSAVQNAITAGKALAAAKKQVKHGEWLPWLKANWRFGDRTAARYMMLANSTHVSNLDSATSIREALRLIDGDKHDDTEDVDVTVEENTFVCETCHESFSIPVWHCTECDHHWSQNDTECKNCKSLGVGDIDPVYEPDDGGDGQQDDEAEPFELTSPVKAPAYATVATWDAMPRAERAQLLDVRSSKTFNRQDNTSIEWAQWSWNPVTGCKHDCPYCYARDIANRFYEQKFEPSFYPDRMDAARNTQVPERAASNVAYRNVFVCSMADLFGKWVPLDWIEAVLNVVANNPQWNFLFLTKFPQRFSELKSIPTNAWLGTTVDCQSRVANAEKAFAKVKGGTKWLSVEPMLTRLQFKRLDLFQWLVVGGASASSKAPAWVPPFDWVAELHWQARDAGCAIYHKDNLAMGDAMRLKEFPWSKIDEKTLPPALKYLDIV